MSQKITGHTRLIAHIGVPTESFTAPLIYNPYFESVGIDAVVVPMGCEAADFDVFLPSVARLRNFAGALITMPHKVSVVGLLDEASPAVRASGACNAVRRAEDGRLCGDMFDGEGFVRGARRKGVTMEGARGLVVGAGGVGSAIAASLAQAGMAELSLFDVEPSRATALARRLERNFPALAVRIGERDARDKDVVVNATPLGMKPGDPLPIDPDTLAPETFVGEVVLSPTQTPFLAAATARGCKTLVGTDMLYEMIPAYLEFFGFPSTSADALRKVSQVTT